MLTSDTNVFIVLPLIKNLYPRTEINFTRKMKKKNIEISRCVFFEAMKISNIFSNLFKKSLQNVFSKFMNNFSAILDYCGFLQSLSF